MLTIEYVSSGKAYSDFEIEQKAKEIIDTHQEYLDQDMIYRTSTDNLIDAIRLYIVENDINPEGWLQFQFSGIQMPVSKFGNPDEWAKGFCDKRHNMMARILKRQTKLRIETR
ncbi:hypothetical protein F4V43_01965 [Paenibacillus spiritus]|uniref:Uncharacterized protein n=1 Tax=Paenibacillus spiritus TaxID=2496557 RepID=A0A5J5GGK1_9BACL|nr:hypothetical protein [Paenibacillus spiritus]KAA9007275.1 hypothetical protein F4V43_01965 [Paenibacillus spiritus]